MKLRTEALSTLKHGFVKVIFSLQVIITCATLPLLYGIGVSHNVKDNSKYVIVKTNKGKVSVELKETEHKAVNNNR